MVERIDADVCIVGAGYAGLTAALRLHQAGRSVVVLEARDRIGGRIWTDHLEDGTPVDRGGGWLAPKHTVMHGLAAEMGVRTYKTWMAGNHLLKDGDRTRTYRGVIPKISPLAIVSIAIAQARLDRMAKKVPVDAPWNAPKAVEWDTTTIADWIARVGIRNRAGRDLFDMAIRGLFTGPLADTSLLDLLFLVHAHGDFTTLVSIEGGSQDSLVEGGAGSIASRMSERLGDAVRLDEPVTSVQAMDDRVVVTGARTSVTARHLVLTIPPALLADLAFDPALPEDRAALHRALVAGPESKTLIAYERPFWREAGFSGQASSPGTASETTLDSSPISGTPGVIASFAFGEVAERVDALDPAERRAAVLREMVDRYGPDAADPVAFVETAWWQEPWTRGCSMAHFPPGVLTRYGHLLREPWGRVHWAGTETATDFHGAMEGAARSGERAAAEILDRT